MIPSPSLMRWSRWAIAIVSIAVGAGVVVSAWSSYLGARDSSKTLIRGQGDILLSGIDSELRRLQREFRRPPTDAAAHEVLERYRDNGLRYLGIKTRHLAEAGVARSTDPVPPRGSGPGTVVILLSDDRARVIEHGHGLPPGPGPPGSELGDRPPGSELGDRPPGQRSGPGGPAGHPPGRPPPPRPTVIIEFEPILARQLMARARRSLWISVVTALLLAIAALVAIRWLKKREAMDRQLESERHLATLGQMSAVLAHEIRNPLAGLKGHAQLLAESLPEGKPRAKADRVVREAIRLEELTNGLLAFVRTGAIERRDIDPAAPLRGAIAETRPDRVALDADSAPGTWSLDAGRMQQVLSNLLQNAFQASPEDSEVEARVTRTREGLIYEIRDHGKGIEKGQEDAIFEAFHTGRTHGTGLGLAVARRVVQHHGGTIHAQNHPDGGALFRIVIPDFG